MFAQNFSFGKSFFSRENFPFYEKSKKFSHLPISSSGLELQLVGAMI